MWKKEDGVQTSPGAPQPERAHRTESPRPSLTGSERATIGRSITIKGDVSGDEDLLIQGSVEGSVDLELHSVTVGEEGRVKANITGRVVTVEGEVEGDLRAKEKVILRSSARVTGDLHSPRIVLEDGASFRGLVDMQESPQEGSRPGEKTGSDRMKSGDSSATAGPKAPRGGNGGTDASSDSSPDSKKSPTLTGKASPGSGEQAGI
jgi:cytoskeletal protein CcmA (bactofilin family)